MTTTNTPAVRHYVAADGGPTALWVEQSGGGCGIHRRAIAFRQDLDRIHRVLWPTLLAQYELVDPTEDDDGPDGIEWQDVAAEAQSRG